MKSMDINHSWTGHGAWPLVLAILLALATFNCGKKHHGPDTGVRLVLQSSVGLSVAEPSGLTLSADGQSLYTVSDQTNRIYQLSLSGELITTLPFLGDDLEGIVCDRRTGKIYLVEEQLREIVELNPAGYQIARHGVDWGKANSGLEGICLHGTTPDFFVLQEKEPVRIIRLVDFTSAETWLPDFATDLSGMAAGATASRFWLVSDESRLLIDWDSAEGVVRQFDLDFPKAEGVAFDGNKSLYLVSEASARLYTFTLE